MNSDLSPSIPNLVNSSNAITVTPDTNNYVGRVVQRFELLTSKQCSICTDTKPRSQFHITPNCTHSFCNDCISQYVTTKVQENIITVKCPDSNCNATITPGECKGVVTKQVVERWEMAVVESMMLVSGSSLYCPFKDCSSLLLNDLAVSGSAECPSCHRLFCSQCKVVWHLGFDCAEFQKLGDDDRKVEDLLAMNLAKENKWRKCPNCTFYVEKISGCSHITCRCTHQFCYDCGSTWSSTHSCG